MNANLLMILFLILYVALSLKDVKYTENKREVFNKNESRMIKGFFCIIVILVHVPIAYQNKVQDVVGSFAYIGVTYYFMASGYGLKYGWIYKKSYLKKFWTSRIPKLLIPAFLCNIVSTVLKMATGEKLQVFDYINIHDWVKTLLILYILFWIVYSVRVKLSKNSIVRDVLVISMTMLLSLIGYISDYKVLFLWPVESIGFVYGIVLANTENSLKKHMNKINIKLISMSLTCTFFLGICYLKLKAVSFVGGYLLRALLGASFILLIILLLQKFVIGNNFLDFMSKISYEFFLLQFGVYQVIAKLININNSAIYIFTVIVITLGLSIAVNWVSRKIIDVIYSRKINFAKGNKYVE